MYKLETFLALPVIKELEVSYMKQELLARRAIEQLAIDFDPYLGKKLETENGGGDFFFTSFETRVKKPKSFFKKLYLICKQSSLSDGITNELIKKHYDDIKDIAGARFACSYEADVINTVKFFRDKLHEKGYGVIVTDADANIDSDSDSDADADADADSNAESNYLADKDFLKNGDESGYRAYHFYIKIPTPIDIFGEKKPMLCEVQARSELQHVWAVKSHELFYKNSTPSINHEKYVESMKLISDHLRHADYLLNEIRNSVKNASEESEQ